jgi:predicted phosphoadenosine phosphosulfate sulfurtransferase
MALAVSRVRHKTGLDVFEAAVQRMEVLYAAGHRCVVSFSAGKDSGVMLEVCIEAARRTAALPVDVIMRDEEVMFPGTFEYAERTAERPEVRFHWVIARQPVINVYNRALPYFWVFDPLLDPEAWVRLWPQYGQEIPHKSIDQMTIPERFSITEHQQLYAVIGLRCQESRNRLYGLMTSEGYITKHPNKYGVWNARPIYDWLDGDVWRAIQYYGFDYNRAYDVMYRLGVPRTSLRIAPPTLNEAGANSLRLAAKAWPQWFDKVCKRLPGVRRVVDFGLRAIRPHKKPEETWEECFQRECIDRAPAWIAERATRLREMYLRNHARHATGSLPEFTPCRTCGANIGCWRGLTMTAYNGDAFSIKGHDLPYVEPETFRPGSGTWGGKPSW